MSLYLFMIILNILELFRLDKITPLYCEARISQ